MSRGLTNSNAAIAATQLEDLATNPEPAQKKGDLRPGDIVIFHEYRGDIPALVHHIYPNGELKLWIFGSQSIFPRDGSVEGTEVGMWSRR
jgi:hypothetical protein